MQKFEQVVVKYDDPFFTDDNSIKSNSHSFDITEEVKRSDLDMMNSFDTQGQSDQQSQRQFFFDFNEQQRRKFNDIVAQTVAQIVIQVMRINNSKSKFTLLGETSLDGNSSNDNNNEDREIQN